MSGGAFDYQQFEIEDIAVKMESYLRKSDPLDEDHHGAHDYSAATRREMLTAIMLLRKAAIYAHRIDWLVSGDDSEETFHRRLAEELAECEKNMVWKVLGT